MGKIILLTDIHFGEHGNSDEFNENCISFLTFMKNYIQENKLEESPVIFLGDWFHTRNQINSKTLNYARKGLDILDSFTNNSKYVLLGNHDLYYSNSRDVTPVDTSKNTSYEIIDKPISLDLYGNKCLICPWLIEGEVLEDLIKEHKPNYVFGHFELPTFWLNKAYQTPGELNWNILKDVKKIITGHYHSRQERNNIAYIGSCFSHNFGDSNDWINRGFAILDTDSNSIEYVEWKDAPKYVDTKITDLQTIMPLLNNTIHLRIVNDIGAQPSELNEVLDVLNKQYGISDAHIVAPELKEETQTVEKMEHIEDINVLITSIISQMSFENLSTEKLIEIYNSL